MKEKEYNICVNQYSDMVFRLRIFLIFGVAQDLMQDVFFFLWMKYKEVEFSKAKAFFVYLCSQ